MTPYLPNGEANPEYWEWARVYADAANPEDKKMFESLVYEPLTWIKAGAKFGVMGGFVCDLETGELYTAEELARLLTAIGAALAERLKL